MSTTPNTPNASKVSNDQLALFVAVAVAVFGGLSFSRSGEESIEKPRQVESADGGSSDAAEENHSTAGSSTQSSRTEETARDSRLIGNWRYTEAFASDGISMVFDQFMTINADGTLTVREGGSAGGGGDFTFEQPQSNESVTCLWRTRGNVIEVGGEGREWGPLAEYEVNSTNLMTTTQGQRQNWERI